MASIGGGLGGQTPISPFNMATTVSRCGDTSRSSIFRSTSPICRESTNAHASRERKRKRKREKDRKRNRECVRERERQRQSKR